MGIIDTVKRNIPFKGEPESDIDPSDFEQEQGQSGSEDNGNQGSEEQESEEQNPERGSPSGEEDNDNGMSSIAEDMEEEIEGEIEEMEEADANRDMSDWYETEGNTKETPDFIENFYDQLVDERSEPETEIERRKEERDKRVEDVNEIANHQRVVNEYKERFADQVSEAFRQLKTKDAPKPAEHGQSINIRGAIRMFAGDKTEERLYLKSDRSEVGNRAVTVVVDGSGSMDELEIKLALYALWDATDQIGDNFAAVTYDTEEAAHQWSNLNPRSNLINGPHEQFEKSYLDSFKAHGYTPTAVGIRDARSVSELSPNSDELIIVVTDGIANVTKDGERHENHSENEAMKAAREQVDSCIHEGKSVIGVGVGSNLDEGAMRTIFGSDYIRTDMNNITQALVDIYRDQMETSA